MVSQNLGCGLGIHASLNMDAWFVSSALTSPKVLSPHLTPPVSTVGRVRQRATGYKSTLASLHNSCDYIDHTRGADELRKHVKNSMGRSRAAVLRANTTKKRHTSSRNNQRIGGCLELPNHRHKKSRSMRSTHRQQLVLRPPPSRGILEQVDVPHMQLPDGLYHS